MPIDRSADLMQALVAKLYATVCGGNSDPNVELPRSKFVSWCAPGIPFTPQDFTFCSKGLVGDTAEESLQLGHQAWTLSKLFDYVPEVGDGKGFIDKTMQQTIFASTQDTISSVYGDVLKFSKVLNNEISAEEKAKVKAIRDTLSVEEVNAITGKKTTKPGEIVVAYNEGLNNYLEAVDEYMNLLIDAQSAKGNDPEAIRRVAAFQNKSKSYIKKMQAAQGAWESTGRKNEYEDYVAYIAQVTEKSLVLYKEDLKQKYGSALLTSAQEGQAGNFYYTTLLPGNFTEGGWTKFSFWSGDFAEHSDKETSEWKAQGKANFGLFSVGVDAGGKRTEENSNKAASNFRASFEFTQIPICRPWFEPGFFSMRAWTLDDAWKLNFDKTVSDGGAVPVGRLVAYPVTALFVRNLRMTMDANSEQAKFVQSSVQAGGSVGYGPFSVGGSYSHGSEKRDFKSHQEGGELVVDGMQLVGMINNIIPKAPNTNPAIKPEQFVGGASVIGGGATPPPQQPPQG